MLKTRPKNVNGVCVIDADSFLQVYAGEVTSLGGFTDLVLNGKLGIEGPWGASLNVVRFGNTVDPHRWEEFYEFEAEETERWEQETSSQTRNLLYKLESASLSPHTHSLDQKALGFDSLEPELVVVRAQEPLKIRLPFTKIWNFWKEVPSHYFQTPFTKPERFATNEYHKQLCSLTPHSYRRPKDLMKQFRTTVKAGFQRWTNHYRKMDAFEEYDLFQ